MPEYEAPPPAAREGADAAAEPAEMDLTVRDAILAAAELNSDVPIPRSPAVGKPPASAASRPAPDDDLGREGHHG
jgi:hypothetical protein